MVSPTFLKSIRLDGFLSFAPDSPLIDLRPLNVLIGPNGSGKSNLIEAVELLHATPTGFASAIRDGGGVQEWLWKGDKVNRPARIEAVTNGPDADNDLRYLVSFAGVGQRTEVIDEVVEEARSRPENLSPTSFYRFQRGWPILNVRTNDGGRTTHKLKREDLRPDESILSQRKGSDVYPEITWLGQQFERIQTFREWSFGRLLGVRQPQPADLPTDLLMADSRNLGLVLNGIEHTDAGVEFNNILKQFLPRYERFSTRVQGGTVQLYLHEFGLKSPMSMTRLSDGTIRFMAIMALLLSPTPPPLLCIEEPELGLHPDAVGLLADLLIDASTRTQLIVTTHSDVLISGFTEELGSVLVCEHLGGTVLTRPDPDRLAYWLENYRLGEIWRIGELGGNP